MARKKSKREKICVVLSPQEEKSLDDITKHGNHNVRVVNRARILLLSHAGKTNSEIVSALSCAPRMICNLRLRYSQHDSVLEAIMDASRPGQPKKITPRHEAFVVATACTNAPPGHNHWTLGELRKALLKKYKKLQSVSDERIRHMLIASDLKPWREKNVVYTESNTAFS